MPPTEPTEIQRPSCPYCGHGKAWRNGRRNGQQRWLCQNCGREHVTPGLSNSLNRGAPYLLLAVAGEKQAERLVGAQNGSKEGERVTCESLIQTSGFLKMFPEGLRSKIIEFIVKRENDNKDAKNIVNALITLQKHGANLYDPESVKAVLKTMAIAESSKSVYADRYEWFLKFLGGSWQKPDYKINSKIPLIPTESEIDQLIAGLTPMIATFCQVAKETGASKGEVVKLKWTDIDFERRIIAINETVKNHATRVIKVSEKCINMINLLPRKGLKLFRNLTSIDSNFCRQRKQLAYRLSNPRLLKVSLHTFRHWHGTMEYHKTKDIIHVQQRLGHKNIRNTLIYITIEEALYGQGLDEYHSAVAKTVEEACKLVDAGFEYVCEFNDIKVFRKRK